MTRFLTARLALIPFLRPDNLAIAAEVCSGMIFDNSAWSAFTKGLTIDFAEYTRWVDEWHRHPRFDWALIPDVIDGDEAANDALLRDWPAHLPGVPVWHLHESLGRLERLCREWPTVALGSSGQWATLKTRSWWRRMDEAMKVCCDGEGRPLAKLHGLRMLDPAIFAHLPLASGDSTNAAVNGGARKRFGMYPAPTTGSRCQTIAERIEAFNSPAVYTSYDYDGPTQDDFFLTLEAA